VKDELQAVVAIDTSGSISDAVLKTFLSEIVNIIRTYRGNKIKMTVLLWDTRVADAFDLDTSKMNLTTIQAGLMNMKATGGGTEISCIKKYLEKKNPGESIKGGLLVFTDGFVEESPILPKAPKNLFLITKDGTDEILKKYGPTYFIDVELT
jgi:predicted metal-dependent peptidase